MGYELTQVSQAAPLATPAPQAREEKVVSMYGNDNERIAKALAKVRGEPTVNATTISDGVKGEASPKAEASLPLSPQLAALARKEQKFRQEQQALKAKELALDTERKELAELRALKTKLAGGDYSEIDKLVDYEKLVQHKLGRDPKVEAQEALESKFKALQDRMDKDVNDRFEAAVSQRRSAVKDLIASRDEFKAIKTKGAEEVVVQLILDTWDEDEIELSPEDAAKEVEKELRARGQFWADLIKEEPKEAAVEKRELPPLKSAKTLTNTMAATGEARPPSRPLHLMTDQERYQEAYRRAQEKLQNRG